MSEHNWQLRKDAVMVDGRRDRARKAAEALWRNWLVIDRESKAAARKAQSAGVGTEKAIEMIAVILECHFFLEPAPPSPTSQTGLRCPKCGNTTSLNIRNGFVDDPPDETTVECYVSGCHYEAHISEFQKGEAAAEPEAPTFMEEMMNPPNDPTLDLDRDHAIERGLLKKGEPEAGAREWLKSNNYDLGIGGVIQRLGNRQIRKITVPELMDEYAGAHREREERLLGAIKDVTDLYEKHGPTTVTTVLMRRAIERLAAIRKEVEG